MFSFFYYQPASAKQQKKSDTVSHCSSRKSTGLRECHPFMTDFSVIDRIQNKRPDSFRLPYKCIRILS